MILIMKFVELSVRSFHNSLLRSINIFIYRKLLKKNHDIVYMIIKIYQLQIFS
jgi:hypothetical protein